MFINLNSLPLGKQILIKRTIQDVGQRELAKALGMHYTTLSRVENCREPLPKKFEGIVKDYLKS